MSDQHFTEPDTSGEGQQGTRSALFAQLVLQESNMALMLLGKVAHPDSGQTYKDVEGARMFIDQLEMLEAKTKGNLTKEESALLKQSLMNLRLAFVEAVESTPEPQKTQPGCQQTTASASSTTESKGHEAATPAASEDEHRKKFSKKY